MPAAYPRTLQHLSIERILDPQPLIVDPDETVAAVVKQMDQAIEQTCHPSQAAPPLASTGAANHLRCALIVAAHQPLGIFTARDLVRLVAQGIELNAIAVSTVMTRPVIVLKHSEAHSIFTVLATLKQRQIHQLPVVDEVGNLLGIVTQTSLLKILEPAEVLAEVEQLQQLSEAQTVRLNQANQQLQQANQAVQAETAERQRLEVALHYANHMLEERVGIQAAQLVQTNEALRRERDFISAVLDTVGALVTVLDQTGRIVRFNRTCEHVSGYRANEVQGQLIWDVLIPPQEQAAVRAVFQQLRQSESANQYENYWVSKDGTSRLISWSNTTLKNAAGDVQHVIGTGIDVTSQRQTEQILARQYRQGHLLGNITRKIRDSLEIEDILQTAVTGVRKLLACDRVVVIKCDANQTGRVIQESIRLVDGASSLLNRVVSGLKLIAYPDLDTPHVCVCQDLNSAPCSLYSADFLTQSGARACIEVAIYVGNQFWGVITASQGDRPHQWEAFEIDLMQQLANQMGVALSQAQLLHNLEFQVAQRTQQLIQTNQQLEWEIQDRIQTESDLRESQQKLAGILDNADEAIISIDSQQRIVLYNQGAERIFGYTFAEAHYQTLDILLPEAFQQIHRQHVHHFAASSQTSQPMANRQRDVLGQRKTGEVFPAAASISKLQTQSGQLFTVILKDITEQRQSEAALSRSEEQLRLTTNALPALICYVDTEQRYCFNNQTYEDWFGISVAALQGCYVWQVMGQAYYNQVQSHIETALSGQRVSFEAEITIPDGRSRYLLTTYIPELTDQGQVKGFFGLATDISDRKATERLKDEFVSVVGHELRTPLTSIHGSLKLLATKRLGTLAPQGQEILAIALKNTERLTRLINDVLDLERIESGQMRLDMQTCNIAELMILAAQAMQTMANEHNVQLSVTPLNAMIWADPDHITQVLTNLLSNAIKFSSAGSTVWLSATNCKTDLMVSIKDQGRGIPVNKLETIFERFQQVDASDSRQRGGTGLGLAICKQIVQQHGGKIWVESTVGEGSTFFLILTVCRWGADRLSASAGTT